MLIDNLCAPTGTLPAINFDFGMQACYIFLIAERRIKPLNVMAKTILVRIDYMDKLPSLNKKIVKVTSLDEIEEEKKYWISKSPLERIEAIEINRRMIYGQDRATSRLQRFFETAELT